MAASGKPLTLGIQTRLMSPASALRITTGLTSLLVGGMVFGQSLSIVDATTLAPVEGVVLVSAPRGVTAISDAKGHVELATFVGRDWIVTNHLGYQPDSVATKAAAGAVMRLRRKAIGLEEVVISASRFGAASVL